ncbi:cupin domain-containing protein [Paenibacillus thiaminolyticus]|uniref:Cupin type-1 domain-containing protein n=1 Tax=Paenibacillus thiaminolyticus TaxID=49283 RepID=A0A3A3GQ39_PANTH|nr:hypothetical protein DQX05_06730 [Paenibacillus thiaminolyticus]
MKKPDYSSPSLNLSYDMKNSNFFTQDADNLINVLSQAQISSLENVSLLDIFLSQGHTVEPHWHPNEAELVYIIAGEAMIGVERRKESCTA